MGQDGFAPPHYFVVNTSVRLVCLTHDRRPDFLSEVDKFDYECVISRTILCDTIVTGSIIS